MLLALQSRRGEGDERLVGEESRTAQDVVIFGEDPDSLRAELWRNFSRDWAWKACSSTA
jgi:hypothetical protein